MNKNLDKEYSKGFQLTFPNGIILAFWKPLYNKQKSYDLLVGKNNTFTKVGTIKNIDYLKEVLFNE